MKLSNKLIIALIIVILGLIAYQVVISDRIIRNTRELQEKQSPEALKQALEQSDIYTSMPCSSIKQVVVHDDVSVQFMKGTESKVYYSDYNNVCVELDEDKLFVSKKVGNSIQGFRKVYVFLTQEPESISFLQKDNHKKQPNFSSIYGFNGSQLLLNVKEWLHLDTDMKEIYVRQKGCDLTISPAVMDSLGSIQEMSIFTESERGKIRVDASMSRLKLLHADIKLNAGTFDLYMKEIHLGNVRITGSLQGDKKKKEDHYYPQKKSYLSAFVCDSLFLDLECKENEFSEVIIWKSLKTNFEDIRCSENITLVRRD